MATKVFYTKGGKRIPFPEFLKRERQERGCTWLEMGRSCGIKKIVAYASKNTQGHPNNPCQESFLKIVKGLGYSKEDFDAQGLFQYTSFKSEEYYDILRKIGDRLLEINKENRRMGRNPQKLSSTAIRKIVGRDTFYHKYAHTFEQRQALYQDLIGLDPKYRSIELQHQVQRRTTTRELESFEEDLIMIEILDYLERKDLAEPERLPQGTYAYVRTALNRELGKRGLSPRSKNSVVWHTQNIWYHRAKSPTFKRGSPRAVAERLEAVFNRKSRDNGRSSNKRQRA